MEAFSLTTQILGNERSVCANWQGRRLIVTTDAGEVIARDLEDALKAAARLLGPGLERAGRKNAPWGLHVSVGSAAAVYGEWPLLQVPVDEPRRDTKLSRLRARWRDGDSPLTALENALEIVRGFSARPRRSIRRVA